MVVSIVNPKKNIVDKKRMYLPTLIKPKKKISRIYSLQKPIRISTYLRKKNTLLHLEIIDKNAFIC